MADTSETCAASLQADSRYDSRYDRHGHRWHRCGDQTPCSRDEEWRHQWSSDRAMNQEDDSEGVSTTMTMSGGKTWTPVTDHSRCRSYDRSRSGWGDWYDRRGEQDNANSRWWDKGLERSNPTSRNYSRTSWMGERRKRCHSEEVCYDWWKNREDKEYAWSGSSSGGSSGSSASAKRIDTPRNNHDGHEQRDHWPDEIRDFSAKYELGQQIASGHRGSIHLVKERLSGQMLVVKRLQSAHDAFEYELLVQKRHPNIIQVFECFSGWKEKCVIMEWCSGGDLFKAVQTLGKPTESWSARIFKQLLSGVRYLHDNFGESHNDIKPENLLLDRSVHNLHDLPRVLLADFGCTALANSVTQKAGGDPRYRAPETFQGALLGFATDVWATGVVLYEMLSGGYLIYTHERNIHGFREFRKHNDGNLCRRYMHLLASKQPVDVSHVCGSTGQDLLTSLLHVEAEERATVNAACVHAWMDATEHPQKKNDEESLTDTPCNPPGSPSKKNARGGC